MAAFAARFPPAAAGRHHQCGERDHSAVAGAGESPARLGVHCIFLYFLTLLKMQPHLFDQIWYIL
ncbi:unnamed protein product, partial [Bubo scandiacus]